MDLTQVRIEKEHTIKEVNLSDKELVSFLFSLGCYPGEPITVISHLKKGCIVSIKDSRYHVDNDLAQAIILEE